MRESSNDMRVLLTGSTGFVGRHLLPLLERAGHDTVRLVRTAHGGGHAIVWDCRDPLPTLPRCDAIVHLAAHVDFQTAFDPTIFQTNVVSTMRLAAFARSQGAQFILTSTAGVHGSASEINAMTPIAPISGYAMSKHLAEEAVRSSGIRHTILRIGGIFGLDGPAHLGVNAALSRAYHEGAAPELRGPGNARRNYICIEDVAQWIAVVLVRADMYGTGEKTLYLAGPEILTIAEHLEIIARVLLSNASVQRMDGAEASDCVITPSEAPFPLTSFASYVTTLQRARVPVI